MNYEKWSLSLILFTKQFGTPPKTLKELQKRKNKGIGGEKL